MIFYRYEQYRNIQIFHREKLEDEDHKLYDQMKILIEISPENTKKREVLFRRYPYLHKKV